MRNYDIPADRAIIEGCLKNDPHSWSALTIKYSRLIEIAADSRLRKYGISLPSQDIADIRQNTLWHIWRTGKLNSVTNSDDISYWLAAVAGNMALSYARKKRCDIQSNAVSLDGVMETSDLSDELAAPASGFAHDDPPVARDLILKAIEKLPTNELLVAKLRFLHGKKYDQIASMLDLPLGTVKIRIKRSKEKISDFLKHFGDSQRLI